MNRFGRIIFSRFSFFMFALFTCLAVGRVATAAQLRLSWADASSNETGFKLERKTGQTGTYGQITSTAMNTTTYIDSTLANNTEYCYRLLAYNSAGNSSHSNQACGKTVTLDTQLPTVTLTAPTNGATVSGATVTVSANASDNVGVVGVQFLLNGNNLGSEDTTSPYSVPWNTTTVANGSRTLTARARDAAGKQATSNPVTVTVNNTVKFTLTVNKTGTGGGTVSSTPVGINCGSTCTASYTSGTVATLTATPAAGSAFVNWSGNADCSDRSVTMNAAKTCTATFNLLPPKPFTLTVTKAGTGSGTVTGTGLNCGADCSEAYASGTSVTLTATPAVGSTFSGWSGSGCSGTGGCTLTLSANAALTATFALGGPRTEEWGNTPTSHHPNTIQDTFLNLNASNNSPNTQLNTYTWPTNQVANAILMRWNLSAIPPGSTIHSATLHLSLQGYIGTGGDSDYAISVHQVTTKNPVITQATGFTADGATAWTANTGSFNNVPLAQADIATAESVQLINKTLGYKTWTVTKMIQAWVSTPTANRGLLLNSDKVAIADSNRYFSSSEYAQAGQRPKLLITYTPPVQGTSALTVNTAGTGSGTITATGINCGSDCTESYVSGTVVASTATPAAGSTFARTLNVKIGLFRPGVATWYLDLNGDGVFSGCSVDACSAFGTSTDRPIVGDWTEIGIVQLGMFDPTTQMWELDRNGNDKWEDCPIDLCRGPFGQSGDLPVAGYWRAGMTTVGIGTFRPSTGRWYLDLNGNGQLDSEPTDAHLGPFGTATDKPVVGNWAGNGVTSIGVFTASTGNWQLDLNGNGRFDGCTTDSCRGPFGTTGDLPIAGDWIGTGRTQIGVFTPATGQWKLDINGNGVFDGCTVDACLGSFGQQGDLPVIGKW